MQMEYKTLVFKNNAGGRRLMASEIDRYSNLGWRLRSQEVSEQGWGFTKTCCLGCLFLPLALLGKKEGVIQVIMERERDLSNNEQSRPV